MPPPELYKQCWELIQAQRYAEATPLAQSLAQSHSNNPQVWHTLCTAARGARQSELALAAIDKAVHLAPANSDYKALKALCLLSCGRAADAIALGRKVKGAAEVSEYALNTLSVLFQACDQFNDQIDITERIVKKNPNNVVGLANYAEVLRNLGRLSEAQDIYNRVIGLDDTAFGAYWGRSQCYTATPDHNNVDALEQRLEHPPLPWRGEMQLCYALAKELEELKEYQKAFRALSNGADLRRAHSTYDVNGDIETMEALATHYGAYESATSEPTGKNPIFVVGLPRSGTTLVERILGSHSQAKDAGELQDFPIEMVKQIRENTGVRQLTKQQSVAASTALNFHALGAAYMDSVKHRIGNAPNFIDKLPLNYLNLGVIARALPNAKIVLLLRNPMDSCYAMYKTMFAEAYPFTYSFDDLSAYYAAWRKLMRHWIETLPGRVHLVRYEALVTDTRNTVAALLKHCDLPWEDACLEFHNRTDGVSTASSAQVRQPIYTSSLEKWRRYETELAPLQRRLQEYGIETESS